MTTKEVAQICGVTESTVTRNASKVGVVLENGKSHDWTEEEVKKLQLALVSNSMNRGNASTKARIVEEQAMQACKGYLSLQAIAQSGNVEAMQEYMQQMVDYTKAQHELLLAQEQNQLLLEQKKAAEAETERIYQVNKNFHNNLYTATDLAKMLGTSPNKIGKIANEHHLKQDPIYGKLGKVQLNNGRWVEIFYYNDDAKLVIENNL